MNDADIFATVVITFLAVAFCFGTFKEYKNTIRRQ